MKITQPGKRYKTNGFTIIEVMIVLGVAALILLLALLAVRQLQRNRRDLQRKNYATRLSASVLEFYGNNRHFPNPANPAEITRFISTYAPKDVDPLTGKPYSLTSLDPSLDSDTIQYRGLGDPHDVIPPVGVVYIQYGHWCNIHGTYGQEGIDDPVAGTDENESYYVVWIGTEGGEYFCVDNYNSN